MKKRFLYLTQTRSHLPEHYEAIRSENSDLAVGYWGPSQDVDGLNLAGTTWTSGRNRLLAAYWDRLKDYDYVVFLDDDLSFEQGDWALMERQLLLHRPLLATPRLIPYGTLVREDWPYQAVYCFDACYNAVRTDVIRAGGLFPYVDLFDSLSWHYSQLIVIHLAAVLYPRQAIQFNSIRVRNQAHSQYPQDLSFRSAIQVEHWLKQSVIRPGLRRFWYFKTYQQAKRALPRMPKIWRGPVPPPALRHGWRAKSVDSKG